MISAWEDLARNCASCLFLGVTNADVRLQARVFENFDVVVGQTGDVDRLVALSCLGQQLDDHRDTSTVEIGDIPEIEQDIAGTILGSLLVRNLDWPLRKGGYLTFQIDDG